MYSAVRHAILHPVVRKSGFKLETNHVTLSVLYYWMQIAAVSISWLQMDVDFP